MSLSAASINRSSFSFGCIITAQSSRSRLCKHLRLSGGPSSILMLMEAGGFCVVKSSNGLEDSFVSSTISEQRRWKGHQTWSNNNRRFSLCLNGNKLFVCQIDRGLGEHRCLVRSTTPKKPPGVRWKAPSWKSGCQEWAQGGFHFQCQSTDTQNR